MSHGMKTPGSAVERQPTSARASTTLDNRLEVAPPHPQPNGGKGSPPAEGQLVDLLRRLRAEAQDLRRIIVIVQAGTTTLQSQADYLAKTKADLTEIQQQLVAEQATDDTVQHLLNILEQMLHNPLFGSQQALPAQEQTNAFTMMLADIQRIELLVGLLTIPTRLNEWLQQSRPGYYVPFHLVFKDEIPNEEDRRTVLNYLAWSPQVVRNGIVDVGNGLVFRYAEDSNARRRSLGWLALGVVLSLVVVLGAALVSATLVNVAPAQRAAAFLVAWLAVLMGVVAHIGVEGAKREQQTKLPTILAVADLRETIDARLGQILWKLLLVVIGFFALAFAIDPVNVSPISGFLVGYSLDSIVGVFGTSLESKVKTIEEQFSPKA